MKAYSTDLRKKIALAYEHYDYTLDEVAELFDVGRRTVTRFVQKHRAGLSLAPQPHAGGCPTALTPQTLSTLRDKVVETPDATLAELTAYLKTKARVRVHPSTVCRALQRLGLPRKKRRSPLTKEMKHNDSPSASGWRALIAASSSLLMKRAFTWLLRAPSGVPRVASASSGVCRLSEGRTIL
jgi:transposase